MSSLQLVQDVEAAKSNGNSLTETNSKKVCDDRLCSEVPGGYDVWKQGTISQDSNNEQSTISESEVITSEPEEDSFSEQPHMVQLSENVYNFNSNFYSSLIVVSENEVLITDTANPARAEILKNEIAKITDLPVTKIILTHEHYEHVGGTELFPYAEIICHRICQEYFDLAPFAIVPEKVDIEYDDFSEIDLDGKPIELHHFGPTDGSATTIIYLPDDKVLQTADLYEPFELIPSRFVDDVNFIGVRESFHEIRNWEIDHSIVSHSPYTDPSELYAHMDFVDDLYDAVFLELTEAYEKEGNFGLRMAAQTLPEKIKLEKYEDWANYDDLPMYVEKMASSFYHGDWQIPVLVNLIF